MASEKQGGQKWLIWGLGIALGLFGSTEQSFARTPTQILLGTFWARSASEDAWLPIRLQSLIAHHLRLLGQRPIILSLASGEEKSPTMSEIIKVTAQVTPGQIEDQKTVIRLTLQLNMRGQMQTIVQTGSGNDLNRLAGDAAITIAQRAGGRVPSHVRALLRAQRQPLSAHRLMGRAQLREANGAYRQARLLYDRVHGQARGGVLWAAIEGYHRTRARLYARKTTTARPEESMELARAARQRADVALRTGDLEEARRALITLLKLSEVKSRRFILPLGKQAARVQVFPNQPHWSLQFEHNGLKRVLFDPRTGVVVSVGPGIPGLVGWIGDHAIAVVGRHVTRFDERLKRRWKVRLPFTFNPGKKAAIQMTSGLLGIWSEDTFAWIDTSFGRLGQVATGIVPLAASPGGVAALVPPGQGEGPPALALLRPGKRTPAWRTSLVARRVAMTPDRIIATTHEGLVSLRAHNGQLMRKPVPMPAASHILGAQGRYAAMATGPHTIQIVDILAGIPTARLEGPSAPVTAHPFSEGVAILYTSGDLIFYDRHGKLLDRAHVPGTPTELLAGDPLAPGPIVLTSEGLFAYAEPHPETDAIRDADVALLLVDVLERLGEEDAALSLATDIAVRSAARIHEAETLRAKVLARNPSTQAAAQAAATRAKKAADPKEPLPSFSLGP